MRDLLKRLVSTSDLSRYGKVIPVLLMLCIALCMYCDSLLRGLFKRVTHLAKILFDNVALHTIIHFKRMLAIKTTIYTYI